jgi:GNAT superfamily N-acetyltransferase
MVEQIKAEQIKAEQIKAEPIKAEPIRIGLLKQSELPEASRIVSLAFGTFLGIPNPLDFMGDRNFMTPRWGWPHVKVIAARQGGRLIGSNAITRWGSFGFFGPLTVLPEYWDRGVAQKLLEATMKTFDKWGVRHTGLYTFAQSAKHVALYQKFGYWPRYLTAIMNFRPERQADAPALLSILPRQQREQAIERCRQLTNRIDKGLDLTGEIRAVLTQHTGDVVLAPNAFAICLNGPGSEGGEKTCYIKFGAARDAACFDKLLDACENFSASRGAGIEAGVNLAREEAFRHMRARGYRVMTQGVAMQRPHADGFNRPGAWVIDDWR